MKPNNLYIVGFRCRSTAIYSKHPSCKTRPYEKLVCVLSGADSRCINIKHRLVYEILAELATVKVLCKWTHYE